MLANKQDQSLQEAGVKVETLERRLEATRKQVSVLAESSAAELIARRTSFWNWRTMLPRPKSKKRCMKTPLSSFKPSRTPSRPRMLDYGRINLKTGGKPMRRPQRELNMSSSAAAPGELWKCPSSLSRSKICEALFDSFATRTLFSSLARCTRISASCLDSTRRLSRGLKELLPKPSRPSRSSTLRDRLLLPTLICLSHRPVERLPQSSHSKPRPSCSIAR